jgi:hypothetical protein
MRTAESLVIAEVCRGSEEDNPSRDIKGSLRAKFLSVLFLPSISYPSVSPQQAQEPELFFYKTDLRTQNPFSPKPAILLYLCLIFLDQSFL